MPKGTMRHFVGNETGTYLQGRCGLICVAFKLLIDTNGLCSRGDAWDVAHAVLFLSSDEARYITGQEIIVNGGLVDSTG